MSSSTALLPAARTQDHPIFLRICHSPWVAINQQTLVTFRFLTGVYLTCTFILILSYDITQIADGWLTVFQFSNIAYFSQTLYNWVAFSWAFMHLYYPRPGSQEDSATKRIQTFLSPPRQKGSTNNGTWFSIFYYAVNSFPYLAASIYWFILVPKNQTIIPSDEILGSGWAKKLFVFNKFGINCLISLIEVSAFSSIKCADAIWAHISGTTFLSLLYAGWAYIGFAITGKFEYYFFNYNNVGTEDASTAVVTFAAAANVAFFIMYGITAAREGLAKKGEQNDSDYQSLPQ